MRWFFTNASPLEQQIRDLGEDVVGNDADRQLAHLPWLQDVVRKLPPGDGDPVARAFAALDGPAPDWLKTGDPAQDGFNAALFEMEGAISPNIKTTDYNLQAAMYAYRPEVLVLTPFYQPSFGFPQGTASKWLNQGAGGAVRVLVGLAQDPETWEVMVQHRRFRGCACRVEHLAVYVTNDDGIARRSAGERRTAVWRPGHPAAGVLAAVRHAAERNNYQTSGGQPW